MSLKTQLAWQGWLFAQQEKQRPLVTGLTQKLNKWFTNISIFAVVSAGEPAWYFKVKSLCRCFLTLVGLAGVLQSRIANGKRPKLTLTLLAIISSFTLTSIQVKNRKHFYYYLQQLQICSLKYPYSHKRLCALVLLFWPGSFVECSVLIGCYFPRGNFQLREIPAMHSGWQWAFKCTNGGVRLTEKNKVQSFDFDAQL